MSDLNFKREEALRVWPCVTPDPKEKSGRPVRRHWRGGHRYPGDAALVKQGVEMVSSGAAKSALDAAQKLAEQAEGASPDAKVDRLRKAIGKGLNEESRDRAPA